MALPKLAAFALLLAGAQCINIETKLDFQGEKQEKPKVLEKVFIVEKNEEKKNDGDVKLVCGDGGCNATGIATNTKLEGSGSIATDIVIEVKTNLGGSKTDTKYKKDEEEVPDVPVVLGYGGLGNSINPEDNAYNPPPLFDTNIHSFTDVRNGNGFIPSYGVPQFTAELSPPRPVLVSDDDYKSVRYNVDQPSGQYLPPPHYLPKPAVNYDPLGPNRVPKPEWKMPSPWNTRHHGYSYQRPYHKPTTHYPWTKCNCHNQNVGWHPTTSSPFIPRAGVQINDKLAPLN